jgi:hypothetical protein
MCGRTGSGTISATPSAAAGQAGFSAGEARRDPSQQVIKQSRVRGIVYAAVSGCCAIVLSHKLA